MPPPSSNIQRRVVNIKEAAQMLGMSVISVRRLIQRGLIHPSRGIRYILIRVEEIERYLRDTEI